MRTWPASTEIASRGPATTRSQPRFAGTTVCDRMTRTGPSWRGASSRPQHDESPGSGRRGRGAGRDGARPAGSPVGSGDPRRPGCGARGSPPCRRVHGVRAARPPTSCRVNATRAEGSSCRSARRASPACRPPRAVAPSRGRRVRHRRSRPPLRAGRLGVLERPERIGRPSPRWSNRGCSGRRFRRTRGRKKGRPRASPRGRSAAACPSGPGTNRPGADHPRG